MKADLKTALEENAKAHDRMASAVSHVSEQSGDATVELKQARENVATTAYMIDKAYRPRHYRKIFKDLNIR